MNETLVANKTKNYPDNRKYAQNHKFMKTYSLPSKMFIGLAAVALTFVGAVATVNAAPPTISLNGQVAQRPLTPGEISQVWADQCPVLRRH